MTLKKIAQTAHVSLSTVSKALSGSKEISEELSQTIIKIALEQGYFEEKGKRKIEYSKMDAINIAVICPEIISLDYAKYITCIKNAVEAKGGLPSVYVYDFDREKLVKMLETITVKKCADGIILFPPDRFSFPSSIPAVAVSLENAEYDTVYCDPDLYFYDIISYLKNKGHTKISFVGEAYTMRKLEAFKNSMKKLGLKINEEDIYVIHERFEQIGYKAAEKMLQKPALPTAVVCAYDEVALALIHRLSEHGVDIPGSVSVIGINDIPMSSYSQIPLTTVNTFHEEKGKIAVNLLYDKILNNVDSVRHIAVKHQLIERKSSGKAPFSG